MNEVPDQLKKELLKSGAKRAGRIALLRTVELVFAAFLVFLLTSYLKQQELDRFDAIPATDWFEVTELFVPNFVVGQDPIISYSREIKKPFQGFWVVEVERRDGRSDRERFFSACSGAGTNNYVPGDYLDPDKLTWSWFIGRECKIPPGTYRLVATWDMKVEEWGRVKRYKVLSNVFTVYGKGMGPRAPDKDDH